MVDVASVADSYWADVFQASGGDVWPGGVHTTYAADGWDGVYVMSVGSCIRIRAQAARAAQIQPLVSSGTLADLMDPGFWEAGLRELRPNVLGPASHFLSAERIIPRAVPAPPVSRTKLEAFLAREDEAEIDEAGILDTGSQLFGVHVDGGLVAVAALSEWAGARSDVGVLTSRHYRGRGYGAAAAAAALDSAIRHGGGFARWRCRDDNPASLAMARRFGLAFYGRNLGIRLSTK